MEEEIQSRVEMGQEKQVTNKAGGCAQDVADAAAVAQALVERGDDAHDERVAAALAQLAAHRHEARRAPLGSRRVLRARVARALARVRLEPGVVIVCQHHLSIVKINAFISANS